jgi:hypothetical protein
MQHHCYHDREFLLELVRIVRVIVPILLTAISVIHRFRPSTRKTFMPQTKPIDIAAALADVCSAAAGASNSSPSAAMPALM